MFRIRKTRVSLLLLSLAAALLTACGTQSATTSEPVATEVTATSTDADASEGAEIGGVRTFVVVPEESTASYLADEEFFDGALSKLGIKAGLADVIGSTQEINGQLQLNLDDLSAPLGDNEFSVDLTALKTDQDRRDSWVQENGPSFASFPVATFVATSIADAPPSYSEGEEVTFKMAGDLTLREITQPVTFEVTATLAGDTLSGIAATRLLMSDFGIDPPSFANTLTVEDEFGLEIAITAKESG